ncbi:MAG: hypothetical protein OEV61_12290, partial [Chloroflexota bacterium]|nr:hypothetical protein [Chloroflexota bacterium]
MRRRLALLVFPALLIGLLPGAVSADPPDQARMRHEAAVAFWTPERIKAAIPRDMTFDEAGR